MEIRREYFRLDQDLNDIFSEISFFLYHHEKKDIIVDRLSTEYVSNYNPNFKRKSNLIKLFADNGIELIPLRTNLFVSKDYKYIVKLYNNGQEHYLSADYNVPYMYIFTCTNEKDKEILDIIKLLETKPKETNFKFHFLSIKNDEPVLLEQVSNKAIKLDITNNYNTNYPIESIDEIVKSDKSGLILLTGIPGSGKSTYIKYLSQENQKTKFCYLQLNNVGILSNPAFITFCFEKLKNSVIVIEDCEKLLQSRDSNGIADLSTILNVTDGIIGDLLNVKIIATLNTTSKIDSALLRKGRLLKHVEFKELTEEQVVNVAKNNNKHIDACDIKSMALCDVYNIEDDVKAVKNNVSIGFKV